MDLLTAKHIKKNFGVKTLLEDVNIIIHEGDKIGLVGVNGSGKSTLLKILAGVLEEEDGEIIRAAGLRCSYLPQDPEYDPKLTVLDQMKACLKTGAEDYVCRSLLDKLGLKDVSALTGTLSGGQRKKIALAAVLAEDADLLILDEPTNHMDTDITEWLEDRLAEFKGAVLMITHDRYFLERVTDHICEIDRGKLISYEGNYDSYLEQKAQRLSMAVASERKRAAIYKKELRWIHWSAPARTTKARGRIQRFEELEKAKQNFEDPHLEISAASSRLGKKIIEIEGLGKSYGDRVLFSDFSYTVLRDDRIGIIGPNGCGKTTFLRILAGLTEPDAGAVDVGETVRMGYFSQETGELDPSKRLIRFVEDIAMNVKTDEGYFSASQMLERFLFPPHMHSTEVGRLSGGEKRRLALLSVLMKAPNVLLLDEPTNDLDIETLTVLEDYLDSFQGAVIIASHDRYFLDRLASKSFAFEKGCINRYNCGFSQYMNLRDQREAEEKEAASRNGGKDPFYAAKNNDPSSNGDTAEKKRHSTLKFSFKEQREYEQIEGIIAELEAELAGIEEKIGDCGGDYVRLMELSAEKDRLEEELLEKMERWEYLSELAAKIEAQGK